MSGEKTEEKTEQKIEQKITSLIASITKNYKHSIISQGVTIEGNIDSLDILDISGNIKGNIQASAVKILLNANVNGNIVTQYLEINGVFNGDIKAHIVSLGSNAVISGSLCYNYLTIKNGASIKSTIDYQKEEIKIYCYKKK